MAISFQQFKQAWGITLFSFQHNPESHVFGMLVRNLSASEMRGFVNQFLPNWLRCSKQNAGGEKMLDERTDENKNQGFFFFYDTLGSSPIGQMDLDSHGSCLELKL